MTATDPADVDTTGCESQGPPTLRQAVIAANASPGADRITLAEPGTVVLTRQGCAESPGFLDVDMTADLTIRGGGTTDRADFFEPNGESRVIDAIG